MNVPYAPNEALRALLSESGLTGGDLARAVNLAARENGLRLSYRRASVAQWLSGVHPRPPVPELVAEALSRALDRPVTPAGAGFGENHPAPADPPVADQLAWLGGADPGQCVFTLRGLDVPRMAELAHESEPSRDTRRVGPEEVAAATAALRLYSEAEQTLGGGMMRAALADYLAGTVGPWLRAGAASEDVRRELLTVASELAYLCGFMCFDDESHGPAQRYYRLALRLAAEAGDQCRYAVTLRAMSVQASALGYHRQAAEVAEAALAGAAKRVRPVTRAFLLGQAAVAAAATGDRRRATTTLGAAEHHLDRSTHDEAVVGAYDYASLAHHRAEIAALGGDRPAAISALQESIRHRPPTGHRAKVVLLARLAELQLDGGRIDEAAGTLTRFLDSYPTVRSGRARSAMTTLRARLRPYQNQRRMRNLLHRAVTLRG